MVPRAGPGTRSAQAQLPSSTAVRPSRVSSPLFTPMSLQNQEFFQSGCRARHCSQPSEDTGSCFLYPQAPSRGRHSGGRRGDPPPVGSSRPGLPGRSAPSLQLRDLPGSPASTAAWGLPQGRKLGPIQGSPCSPVHFIPDVLKTAIHSIVWFFSLVQVGGENSLSLALARSAPFF